MPYDEEHQWKCREDRRLPDAHGAPPPTRRTSPATPRAIGGSRLRLRPEARRELARGEGDGVLSQAARRAVKRPPVRVSDRESPKVSDRAAWVRTSSAGPAATTSPARRSSAWVYPGGISSTWWVTSTCAGA